MVKPVYQKNSKGANKEIKITVNEKTNKRGTSQGKNYLKGNPVKGKQIG